MELKDAKDVTKLVKTAVRRMVNDYKAERAVVIVDETSNPEPTPNAAYGFDSENIWTDATVPVGLLRHTLDRGKPTFILDAEKNDQISATGINRSIICVPLGQGHKNFRGLLYCDHPEPGKLDHSIKKNMDKLGVDFDRRYYELASAPKPTASEARIQRQEADDEEEADRIFRSIKLTALFLFICTVIVFYVSQ